MNIKDDSRKIAVGDIFVDLSNNSKYVLDTIEKGAKKVIVSSGSYEVETIVVPDTKDYLINHLRNNYYQQKKS